jgi:translation initiation factor 1 (eIF-1/SUI1)
MELKAGQVLVIVTELQKQHIRERLESIYSELASRFGAGVSVPL